MLDRDLRGYAEVFALDLVEGMRERPVEEHPLLILSTIKKLSELLIQRERHLYEE